MQCTGNNTVDRRWEHISGKAVWERYGRLQTDCAYPTSAADAA